jgi:hypothetical protein
MHISYGTRSVCTTPNGVRRERVTSSELSDREAQQFFFSKKTKPCINTYLNVDQFVRHSIFHYSVLLFPSLFQRREETRDRESREWWVMVQHVTWPYGGPFGRRRTENSGQRSGHVIVRASRTLLASCNRLSLRLFSAFVFSVGLHYTKGRASKAGSGPTSLWLCPWSVFPCGRGLMPSVVELEQI